MSESVYIVDHELFEKHNPGSMHPESPQRLIAIRKYFNAVQEMNQSLHIEPIIPTKATHEQVALIHEKQHIETVDRAEGKVIYFDPDTGTSPESVEAAYLAAGGGIALVEKIVKDEQKKNSGFALLRPPGHHAESAHPMGFCLFNNVAIAAKYAQQQGWAKKVCIMDWDVHHGNGTQHSFEKDPNVMYLSTHHYPFFPGTGSVKEIGFEDGIGTTVNVPLPGQSTDGDYGYVFQEVILPAIEWFNPDLILVSAGFDAHIRDPLGGMRVSTATFATMCSSLLDLSTKLTNRGIALFLEGGYDLVGIGESSAECLKVLAGNTTNPFKTNASPQIKSLVKEIKELHENRW